MNRVVCSTNVPIAELPRPMIRSPSQCPGTARFSASAGRSLIMISGPTDALPRPRRRALGTRNARPVRRHAANVGSLVAERTELWWDENTLGDRDRLLALPDRDRWRGRRDEGALVLGNDGACLPGELFLASDIIRLNWPAVGKSIRAQLYGDHAPIHVAPSLGMINEDKPSDRQSIKVFISHATADAPLAEALVDLFQAALKLPNETIRCTSVTGYRLRGGANVTEQLRREVHDAASFIGIISHRSIRSPYVLFELGARWGAHRHLLPVLAPGTRPDVLAGPLSEIHALETSRDGLHQLVEDLGNALDLTPTAATTYQRQIDRVLAIPATTPTDIPTTPVEDHSPALSPEAQELLMKAANCMAGAVLILKLSEGTSISCGKEFTQRGNLRSEAKWKRAVEELQQAGFLEDGDGSSRKVTDAGFQMADTLSGTLSGKEQSPAAQVAEAERLTAGLSPAVPDPSVPPPTPPDRPGPDGILHYPAHWYALPLPGTEELIDVRCVENAAELDELKASDPTREWWDTPAKWPGLECAEIRRVDGRPYRSG